MLDLTYEKTLWHQGTEYIIGIDEVGRGPLAGPVIVGAVIFDKTHSPIEGVNDSKKIAKKLLPNLSNKIKTECRAWSVGCGTVKMINEKGIIFALQYAISEAVAKLQISNIKFQSPAASIPPFHSQSSNIQIIIDGLPYKDVFQFSDQCQELHQNQCVTYQPKADGSIYSVAAASIIAKVYRDELMSKLNLKYPQYGWKKNAGYGTKIHRTAIQKNGLTEEHRQLFCRKAI